MALISAAAFKTQVAGIATALSVCYKDTVDTRMPTEIRNPKHPLRQIEKYLLFDSATGITTADDAYIDAVYGGATPNKSNPFDFVTDIEPLTLVSATVENAAPADVVLTFLGGNIANAANIVLGGDASPAKIISDIVTVTVVVTITVTAAYVNGDVITVSGDFRTSDDARITLTENAVVNNVL